MTYRAAPSAPFDDEKANVIGAALERLREKNGGYLTNDTIVNAARSPKSVFHGYFQWDDARAAANYRARQAQHLVASIYKIVDGQEVRAFQSVIVHLDPSAQQDSKPLRVYVSVEKTLSDEDLRDQVFREIARAMTHYRKKLEALRGIDVHSIVDKIGGVIEELEGKMKSVAAG